MRLRVDSGRSRFLDEGICVHLVARIVMGRVYGVTTKGRSLFSTRLDEIHSLAVCQSMIFG